MVAIDLVGLVVAIDLVGLVVAIDLVNLMVAIDLVGLVVAKPHCKLISRLAPLHTDIEISPTAY